MCNVQKFENVLIFCLGCVFVSLLLPFYEQSSDTNLHQIKGVLEHLNLPKYDNQRLEQ